MDEHTQQLHVVAGATGTGKTAVALLLAHEHNGELINADSRQIYKYLDVGTNKGLLTQLDQVDMIAGKGYPTYLSVAGLVPVHLVSFLEPDQAFSVYEYQKLAQEVIADIFARGKTPILVGGTGLYIDSIIHPNRSQLEGSSVDQDLRAELNALSVPQLQERLTALGEKAKGKMNHSDWNNPRRLVRKIERALAIESGSVGLSPENDSAPTFAGMQLPFGVVHHYTEMALPNLRLKLKDRAEEMWHQGLVAEVEKVLQMGFPPDCPGLLGIGYNAVLRFLRGELTDEQAISHLAAQHADYAKRQITWFKKYFLP